SVQSMRQPAPGAAGAQPRNIVSTIELAKPLPGHHGEITRIELREPDFGDWIECGDLHETTVIDPAGMARGEPGAARVTLRPEAVAKWFQRLSGLPYAAIAKMSLKDARAVLGEVADLVESLDVGKSRPRQ